MDDSLIDSEDLSLGRKSVIPGEGFFVPDSLEESHEEEAAAEALDGASVAVVADPDADGLACVALVRELYGDDPPEETAETAEGTEAGEPADETDADDDSEAGLAADVDVVDDVPDRVSRDVALVPAGPHDLEEGIEYVAEYGAEGIDLFVCDLCPDRYEYVEDELEAAVERADTVRWFDHHQWDDEVAERVREAGVDLVVGDSDEECSADVALRSLDHDFPRRYKELASVTRDHDLWIREDPRSDDLADYSYWSGAGEYVDTVMRHGPDLPEDVLAFVEEQRVEKQALIDRAVDRADMREVGPWTVGVTYGRCSQNEVAEALREQGADASVVVKPAGSASIRGTDAFERCHEVARQVNGGGHPKAAGCKPDIYDDMLDYANHWTTRGAVTKQVILEAFLELVPEDGDEEDSGELDDDIETTE
ncbi:phosphohydrolase [Halostella sp. JP-L12]|uniref:DHH family phosphoesterase n=1 Tax=Halostella TaxID=1843185 RepID=UPI000EF79CF2|nr:MULTISPECIES: phosphohydrolase [Halostella]NHN48345.1 phosphohydrolase [Halostella sp. JP-L12]